MAADRKAKDLSDMPKKFVDDGVKFLKECKKPDQREFTKISQAVGVGFLIMGAIGYVVKLFHIPINNILVGGQ